jgi:hypothetical protein
VPGGAFDRAREIRRAATFAVLARELLGGWRAG